MLAQRVDVGDDEAMSRWHGIYAASRAVDSPGLPTMQFPEILQAARHTGDVQDELYYLRVLDGQDVGICRLRLPKRDNLDSADLLLAVHPDHRGRGHGRALVEHAVEQVRLAGRHRVMTEVVESGPGGERAAAFAAAAGFRRALAEAHRVLDLSRLDLARLTELERQATEHAEGYELLGWTGPVPDDLIEGYAALAARMTTDAPMDDLTIEPEVWDADRVRTVNALIEAQGRTMLGTVARPVGSGELVAYSTIGISRHDPVNAFQWDTLVRADHRGHRLGMLVKVANLRRLLRDAPEAERLHTWNAVSNDHMVAINEAMGFEVVALEAEWQLDLA